MKVNNKASYVLKISYVIIIIEEKYLVFDFDRYEIYFAFYGVQMMVMYQKKKDNGEMKVGNMRR